MFLASLNEDQKKSALAIAMRIIGSDGKLDKKERAMIEAMRYEMGLFHEIEMPHGSLEELVKPFDTKRSRSILLMEGIALAYSDTDYSEKEKRILRALAIIFEITEEDATEIENWVLQFRELQKKAEQILSK